jgi:Xaa-Pro aminopeptidase
MSARLQKLRSGFPALKVDAFFVTFPPHLRYMSGFSGSSGVGFVSSGAQVLVTDGRYAVQAATQAPGWRIIITQTSLFEEVARKRILRTGMRVGFDGNSVTYAEYLQLKARFPGVRFLPRADVIENIAAVKDEEEISKIREAVRITDMVFRDLLTMINPGVAEADIAAEISYRQRRLGAEADAFETIVASGERSALPHGRATSRKIRSGDLVTLDFGCVVDGYHSDLTRTIAVGRLSAEKRKMYAVVRESQERAIDAAVDGMKTRELDAVARNYIKDKGYSRYFRHSLGHGIGLQIHEAPRISVLSTATLRTGNVITIEPGIYIPGVGGVRIEDDIVIRNGRCEVLNRSAKDLIVL